MKAMERIAGIEKFLASQVPPVNGDRVPDVSEIVRLQESARDLLSAFRAMREVAVKARKCAVAAGPESECANFIEREFEEAMKRAESNAAPR